MAKEKETNETAAAPSKGGAKRWVVVGVIGLLSAGSGFLLPQILHVSAADPAEATAHNSEGSDGEIRGLAVAYVPFGDVVANLDDNRMTRYLRAKFSLSVEKRDVATVQRLVEEQRTFLKNWLIGYFQSKQLEEIRGTAGFNRIRREIHEQFNMMLFPDGEEKIKEILFDEFNVQ